MHMLEAHSTFPPLRSAATTRRWWRTSTSSPGPDLAGVSNFLTFFCLVPRSYDTPLVADIHFQPKVAMMVAEAFEKIRINPGGWGAAQHSWVPPYLGTRACSCQWCCCSRIPAHWCWLLSPCAAWRWRSQAANCSMLTVDA